MWPLTDEALIAGFAAGDPGAAATFVRRFQSKVYGLAVTMVGDRAVAEELAQETFTRAWKRSASYDPRKGRVVTWLLAITRNLAIDHLRANRTSPVDPTAMPGAEALWTRVRDSGSDEPGAITQELRDALGEVPDDQRRALLMAALFGYTAKEIAAIEDIPLGTAKTRIRAATLKLTSADRQLPGEGGPRP